MAEPLVAFRVTVPSPEEDRASGILWDCQTRGIEIRAAGQPGLVELIAYFENRPDLTRRLTAALHELCAARIEPHPVHELDWVAHVRDAFRPLSVGGFRILPAWQVPPPPPGPRTLLVDPGRAFGTGAHETTRLCLAALESVAAGSRLGRLLDLGAGSGILAIAGLRLGAVHATASDLDPDALASAAQHARLNAVELSLLRGDGGRPFRPASFDAIVANLSGPLLCARRTEILELLRPGGRLVLSGFLREDVASVREAYAGGGAAHEAVEGDWAALTIGTGAAGS